MFFTIFDFNKNFDENYLITNCNPTNNKEFSSDGIFSKEIFGDYDSNVPIDRLAWMDLGEENYIINPLLFNYLSTLMGQKTLMKMINYEKSIDRNGNEIDSEDKGEDEFIGLYEFRNRFDELFEKYSKNNKEKYKNEYYFIKSNKKHVFVNKLPIFSSKLRPGMVIGTTLVFDDINNTYNFLLKYIMELKNNSTENKIDLIRLPLLFSVQLYANSLFKTIINSYLKGKKGFLRKSTIGNRLNNVSRTVITPCTHLKMEQISIPYIVFGELYKYQLINIISNIKNIPYYQAFKIWQNGMLKFDEELYSYMEELRIKTKGGLKVLLNRKLIATSYSNVCRKLF